MHTPPSAVKMPLARERRLLPTNLHGEAMTSWILAVAGVLAGVAIGWLLWARRPVPDPHAPTLRRIADQLGTGRRPVLRGDETAEVAALVESLDGSWIPRNEGREQALREALGRIAAFLREQVRRPLEGAVREPERDELLDAAERALGGLDDLEFFLREPLTPDEVHNLVPLVQQVTREFAADWDVTVRMRADDRPIRAHVHKDTFLDAVYLLLHNAGQFGRGTTIDVTALRDGNLAKLVIRDRGPGFSAEALERAHDLFYSTTPAGLGLGIPFARKIIEGFGGEIRLRNVEDGGAEVELALPLA